MPVEAFVDVVLEADTVEFTMRVTSQPDGFSGVAWTLAYAENASVPVHFQAGEGWQEERLQLYGPITLRIGADATSIVELVTWAG